MTDSTIKPSPSAAQRIISNVVVLSSGQLLTWVLSLAYFVVIGRYLGPAGFGQLVLARTIVAVLWLFATLGMETLILRTAARDPHGTYRLASASVITRTALGLPLFVALFLIAHFMDLGPTVTAAMYLFGLAEVLWSVQRVFMAVFQGRERMKLSAMWSFGRNGLELVLALVVVALGGGVVGFAATELPAALVLTAFTIMWMKSMGPILVPVERSDVRSVVTGGLAFWANDVFFNVYLYIDSIILGGLAGTAALGFYTPATKLFSVPMFLTGILGTATLPHLSRLGVTRGPAFGQAARKVLGTFTICGVLLTVGLATFARPLIVIIFGSSYRAAIPVLFVLSLAIVPMFLNFEFSQILTACDRQWWWTGALAGSCVLNPLLNFILIPVAQQHWANGAVGAAMAWLFTEIAELVFGVVLLWEIVADWSLIRTVTGALTAGVAQLLLIWLVGKWWLPAGEITGVVGFGCVAIATGAISRTDLTALLDMIRDRVAARSSRMVIEGANS